VRKDIKEFATAKANIDALQARHILCPY